MTLARSLCLTICLLTATGGCAWALDPMRADILSLRLGMTEAEATARLAAQGLRWTRVPGSIQAVTKDGGLTIGLAESGPIARIAYTFTGRGQNEDAVIRAAVIDHYGQPSTEAPLTWCRAPAPDGRCPSGQPLLTFVKQDGVRGILTLSAGK